VYVCIIWGTQAKMIREKYFEAILRQNVAWFDSVSTGDLTNRLTADMALIQEGMSDKVGCSSRSPF
jgi:ATP-binding cassette, subfamily B (MDR/TAP), member 1